MKFISGKVASLTSNHSRHADLTTEVIAGCCILFYRYSGQAQIPLAVFESNSGSPSEYRMIGVPIKGKESYSNICRNVNSAFLHGDNAVQPDHEISVAVLISSLDSDSNAVDRAASPQNHIADLHLYFRTGQQSLIVNAAFDANLFDQATIERMVSHLQAVLKAAQEDSSLLVSQIEIFNEAERRWLHSRCNGTVIQNPNSPLHAEVEEMASRYPEKTAVLFKDLSLTYRQLNNRANQLARYLQSRGIASDDRIVVCIEPCLDVAIVLLAIFKAGATYVPLNPGHPRIRIRTVLHDVRPKLIITQQQLNDVIDLNDVDRLVLDKIKSRLDEFPTSNLDLVISAQQVAYIYYTSGTTGKPKGIMATYANMVNSIHVTRSRFGISKDDVMTVAAAFTFSISMFELMSALSVGGAIVVLEREHVLDPRRMAETLKHVTMFHVGPSLLRNILQFIKENELDFRMYAGVRHASSGGDTVPPDLLVDLRSIFGSAEVFVFYGCSEITLTGCSWKIPSDPIVKTYVGKPFNNVRMLVLDDDGNQVPIGAVGDVCIGGPGVVRGYLNQPNLEEQLFFVRDGCRYYRTGDRGRLDSVGKLELLGRRDFQIQVRGMRVELAEIDYHLRRAPGVRDGITAAKSRADGEKALIAYFVPEENNSINVEEIRRHIQQRLPDYMIPALFVELNALPLNPNMKVDRLALPDFHEVRVDSVNLPRSETEKFLARTWCELLDCKSVDLEDNFMMLGGDSLLAVQLILHVERSLGCKLEGIEILRESLAVLARYVDERSTMKKYGPVTRCNSIKKSIRKAETFYFGSERELYGLFQHGIPESKLAPVLICPPIGYEFARCQYFLQLLSEKLAMAGAPSLRFHYFGSGDSLGEDYEATIARWRSDLRCAFNQVRCRTGADRIRIFSLRLSTMLAMQSLSGESVDRWVAWDPVISGAGYYEQLRRMNSEKENKLLPVRNLKKPRQLSQVHELVGTGFSRSSIEEIVVLDPGTIEVPCDGELFCVLSADYRERDILGSLFSRQSWNTSVRVVNDKCGWYDLSKLPLAITHKSLLVALHDALIGVDT